MKRLVVALVPLLSIGCPAPGGGPCRLVGGFLPVQRVALGSEGAVLVEGPVTIRINPSAQRVCPNGTVELPEGVALRVYDPHGREVEHTVAFNGDHARLSLDAAESGWYHVEAEFLPAFGLTQLDFLVMRAVETKAETELPRPCFRLTRLGGGAWGCDQAVIFDGGVVDDRLLADQHWIGAGAVWTYVPPTFRRYRISTHGALELEAAGGPLPPLSSPSGAINESGELYLRDFAGIYRVRALPDGGVEGGRLTELTSGSFGAIAVSGELAMIDEFGGSGLVLNTYGPLADGGYGPLGSPRGSNFSFAQMDHATLWSFGPNDIRAFSPTVSGAVARGSILLPQDLFVQHTANPRPLLMPMTGGFPPPVVITGDADSLELMRLWLPGQPQGAGADFAWQQTISADGVPGTRVLEW